MTVSAKWAWAAVAGLAVLAAATGLSVPAPGVRPLLAAGAPPRPDPAAGAGAKPAADRVAEIALPGPLLRAAATRDGKRVAAVTRKGPEGSKVAVVTFWDTATGKQVGTLGERTNHNPLRVALSPDGAAFAWLYRDDVSEPDVCVQVFDTKTGALRCTTGPESVIRGGYPEVRFSPDGKSVATSAEINAPGAPEPNPAGGVLLWDAGTGKPLRSLWSRDGYASAVQFAGAGKQIVTVDVAAAKAVVWDAASGEPGRAFDLPAATRVMATAITPDGRKLVTFRQGGAGEVWDVGTGQRGAVLADPGGDFLHAGAVDTSPDGTRAAAVVHRPDGGLALQVWDLGSGERLVTKENVGPQTVFFDAAGRVGVSGRSLDKVVFHAVPK